METLSGHRLASKLAKLANRPVLYLAFSAEDVNAADSFHLDGRLKAAPYLTPEHAQFLVDGGGCILCESEEEMQDLYERTVGDDGPTSLNPYAGPMRVYACTFTANGEAGSENT